MKLLFSKTWLDTASGEEIQMDITNYSGDISVEFYTDTYNIDMDYNKLEQALAEFRMKAILKSDND